MLNIKNQHIVSKYPLFNLGFRPFFLGAVIFAIIAMTIWMAMFVSGWNMQIYGLAPVTWHAHEMIFGYAMAVITGFLLTAVKNWTNIQTPHGTPLFVLFLLWIIARVLPFFGGVVPIAAIAIIDNLFMVLFIISIALPIFKKKQ